MRHTLWDVGYAVDTLETAADWSKLPTLVDRIEDALKQAVPGLPIHVFTHLSHIYPQGASIYTSYIFPNGKTYEDTLAHWKVLKEKVSRAVVNHGGTISHQHGVGRDHAPYLGTEKGEQGIRAIRALQSHFDPEKNLNAGVLLEDA